jgi:omega-amidase
MKIAICQIKVANKKQQNFQKVNILFEKIMEDNDINILILPECWNSPYGTQYFNKNAEYLKATLKFEGEHIENTPLTYHFLKKQSLKYPQTYIIGGSIPEIEDNRIYNTCPIFLNGELINTYRKMHLYDINLEKHKFRESDVLTPGDKPCIIETPWGKIGLGICFDIRFPELATYYRQHGCKLIVYPGAFNMITGNLHWELLQRARALDNMLYIATCSVAFNKESDFNAWGHSAIVDPWGRVIKKLDENEGIIITELDFEINNEIRNMIPCLE